MKKPSLVQALIVALFTLAVGYLLSRSLFIAYVGFTPLEKALAWLFFAAECFIMIHGLGYFYSVYNMNLPNREPKPADDSVDIKPPSVAVLIPSRHEPKDMLWNTINAIKMMDYPNFDVYLLDDSCDEKHKREADELAKEMDIQVFRREIRHGAKAGIINDCVKALRHDYVCVFDADQSPIRIFLSQLIPLLENEERLAFVQTPQFYSNLSQNRISLAANMQQAVFYEYVCEGKSHRDSMICCGTNVVFRRQALEDIGGLDESSVTEDFASSAKFHSMGWHTYYHNHVYTFGKGPEDLRSYFKQQNRWALGNVGVLRRLFLQLFTNPTALNHHQWFEYFITGSYYLIGWAYLFLMGCPILFIFANIPSFFMDPYIYALTYLPFLILSWVIFYASMGHRNYKISEVFRAQLLGFIALPIYARAALSGIFNIKSTFDVTAKNGSASLPYWKLTPQIFLWSIHLAALTWGVHRMVYEQASVVAINCGWVLYHFILLSGIYYFNEIRREPHGQGHLAAKAG